jgi:hypothetical protein
MDVRGISKINMGYLDVTKHLGMIFGVMLYSFALKKIDVRNLLRLYFLANLARNGLYLAFIKGLNKEYGVSDVVFLGIHGFIFDGVLILALFELPILVVLVKLAPRGIEGTALSALVGLRNFAIGTEGPLMGSFINY